jgi:hypothetical protein
MTAGAHGHANATESATVRAIGSESASAIVAIATGAVAAPTEAVAPSAGAGAEVANFCADTALCCDRVSTGVVYNRARRPRAISSFGARAQSFVRGTRCPNWKKAAAPLRLRFLLRHEPQAQVARGPIVPARGS